MEDRFGRNITGLDMDMNSENEKAELLTPKQIGNIALAAANTGITRVKLTGSEPLERKNLKAIIREIKAVSGISDISLATSGALLSDVAGELAAAGLDRVDINLNTLRYNRYEDGRSGEKLESVIEGINAATDAKLKPVRINVKLYKGFNDDELMDFIQLIFQHEYELRFTEVSAEEAAAIDSEVMTVEEIKKRLPALVAVDAENKNDVYKYSCSRGKISFSAPYADGFCRTCGKLYLTEDGLLKSCKEAEGGMDLKPIAEDIAALEEAFKKAVSEKEEKRRR